MPLFGYAIFTGEPVKVVHINQTGAFIYKTYDIAICKCENIIQSSARCISYNIPIVIGERGYNGTT